MPNVAFKRPELTDVWPQYEQIRDAIAGSPAIKKAKTKYLPKPNAADTSPENAARYRAYITRAIFYGVTKRTNAGLIGQMFFRDPVIEVVPALQPVVDDANGEGVSLTQLAKAAAGYVLPYGRAGLFIDYPITEGPQTREDIERETIRPTIELIAPWNVINWRAMKRGAESVNTLIVIEEEYIASDDGFEMKKGKQWRVLRLIGEVYSFQIWRKSEGGEFFVFQSGTPLNSEGKPFSDIPFVFIGAENNDSEVDQPPMFDLSELNIGHYRNSADYEESTFLNGQPTPVFTGLTETWADKFFKDGVGLGARAAVPLPVGGTAELLQSQPNTQVFEAMEHKERQMVALGAKLVEDKKVQRTATEAGQEEAGQSSVLSTVAGNISLGFTWALGWAADFIGEDDDAPKFVISSDFSISKMSAEDRAQTISEWQAEAITFSEMRAALRAGGSATLTDEEAIKELTKPPIQPQPARVIEAANEDDPDEEPADEDA